MINPETSSIKTPLSNDHFDLFDSQDSEIFSPTIMPSSPFKTSRDKKNGSSLPELSSVLRDQFIGEFTFEQGYRIIRAFVDQNERDRIYYTKCEPLSLKIKANVLIIHGYGDSSEFIEVR